MRVSDKPDHIGLDNKPAIERDRIELNLEMSGASVGRIRRFLPEDRFDIYGENDKKKSERRFRNMLDMLLAEDARYRKLYFEVRETLDNARRAVHQTLIDINRRLDESERTLRLFQENASRLNDGTFVFLSTHDGHVYTEHGNKLSHNEAQRIVFSQNSPSWEDYNAAKESLVVVKEQKSSIETYERGVLGRVQERMENVDDPPSLEELEDLQKRLENAMPDAVKVHYNSSSSVSADKPQTSSTAQTIQGKANFSVPDLDAAFNKARQDTDKFVQATPANPISFVRV
jgi:hypothetical protein